MQERSQSLFAEARDLLPGGVNSPVRACVSVGCEPVFLAEAKGAAVTDVDGNVYIDFVQGFGPAMLGHGHPAIAGALRAALDKGLSNGAPCEDEVRLAKAIVEAMPAVQMVRMANSGTEAAMTALRLARAYTGRKKFIKFDGGYHGHAESFLHKPGSGLSTTSAPGSAGVPDHLLEDTLVVPYNNLSHADHHFRTQGEDIACVIVEPVAANMGVIPPTKGFLQGLRALCDKHKALLVFDEVITGFRATYGGAQSWFGVFPDLTVLGKIIGGGLPIGAVGGKKQIMKLLAPEGEVFQAGTFAGNPLAMAAGLAMLKELKRADYKALETRVENFCQRAAAALKAKEIPCIVNRFLSMFCFYFAFWPVTNLSSAQKLDPECYGRFYQHMRAKGILFPPSAYEVCMTSFAHTDEDFEATLAAVESFTG